MNRRGFLKLFGLGAAAIALPKTLLAFSERTTQTVKASVEKIKTKFTPKKIKPVGKMRISAEYLANNCNCPLNPNLLAAYKQDKRSWGKTIEIFLNNTHARWTKKEHINEHIA